MLKISYSSLGGTIDRVYKSLFNNKAEGVYRELELPFDQVKEDYIGGEELVEALTDQEVLDKIPGYKVSTRFNREVYEVWLGKFSALKLLSGAIEPAIQIEVDPEEEYSHLSSQLYATNSDELEALTRDIERIEEGFESYFQKL